ncbi:PIN-like domain-containing protein [Pengzhenrongella frigida]|uniref:PIN like domain-containing protein n=1 Tax=Pengzhenrongella frigida TaxID=1259133 RepID=A0A4Q5MUX0_9MICO|nr:PIN-like domain-containing protein [Cellulomonas sp. HLT2-17]RYV49338.1 hypothetical protein EUA98_19335 [Cellulomonas sp. HLT2-17]
MPSPEHGSGELLALGLDANVLLKLGKMSRAEDVADYLGVKHRGPVIVPAQAIQEFWKNHLSLIRGTAESVKLKFDELARIVDGIDPVYASTLGAASIRLMGEFRSAHGDIMDGSALRRASALMDALSGSAIVPDIPRQLLFDIAEQRKKTKTPPGFKDEGHGDFFVWAEFLHGLLLARSGGRAFNRAIFVTDDVKKDWSTKGKPHPVLVAEVQALTSVPFETWTVGQFHSFVVRELDEI